MKKNIIKLGILTVICFLTVLFCISMVCVEEGTWFANVFSDKLYIFFLIPLYRMIVLFLDISRLPSVVTRIGNRRKAMITFLILEYGAAVLYLCIWFSFIITFTMVKFPIHEMSVLSILDHLLRYLLGLFMAADIAFIFRCSSNTLLSAIPDFCSVFLCVLDIMVLQPKIIRNIAGHFGFVFSWIFKEGISGYIGTIVVLIVLHVYLLTISINKDII